MKLVLAVSRAIDALNERVGRVVLWLVLVMVLVSAGNALSRYALNLSSNAWLELQWYLFAAVFLLCSGYTLLHNEHIRIDVVSSRLSRRTQVWIDIFGTLCFLFPLSITIMCLSWPIFVNAWVSGEISSNAGGLIRWPARLLVPVGFFLLPRCVGADQAHRISAGSHPGSGRETRLSASGAAARGEGSRAVTAFVVANMAPLMFAALVVFLLLGYPVAFALAAIGLSFGLLGVQLGLLHPALFQALPERIFGIMGNDTLLAVPFFTFLATSSAPPNRVSRLFGQLAAIRHWMVGCD